jgi:acylpyruvate hydrolase
MRLVTYQHNILTRIAVLNKGYAIDLNLASKYYCQEAGLPEDEANLLPTDMLQLLKSGAKALKTAEKVLQTVLDAIPQQESYFRSLGLLINQNELVFCAPIPNPGKVLCIGGNFPAANKLTCPDFPTVFLKPSNTLTGNGNSVRLPALTENVAYETELAVVINQRARNLTEANALSCVAGYTVANDIGDRALEKRTSQWTSGKMFDTFTPMGPALVTCDEIPDTSNFPMLTRINGETVQKGSTNEMFFNVRALISYLSSLTTLEPGDVILTGSPKLIDGLPAPVIALKPGDRVEVSVGEVGILVNPVVAE